MIKLAELSIELEKILNSYSDEVVQKVEKVAAEVAEEGAAMLKATSPKHTGKYASGWAVKDKQKSVKGVSKVIYNAKRPSLTHILEKGFTMRNGKFRNGQPHIKPVEQIIQIKFVGMLEMLL